MAPGAELVAVRVYNCRGEASTAGILAGIEYVIRDAAGPAVANMSFGGEPIESIDAAVVRAVKSGVTVVIAAGNEGDNACNYTPARVREAITVGATRRDDVIAGFSNFGPCVDLFAPGHDIVSTWPGYDAPTRTERGTSMAAPHVAGAAALYLQRNPSASPAEVEEALVAAATRDALSGGDAVLFFSRNRLLYVDRIGGDEEGGGGHDDDDDGDDGEGGDGAGTPRSASVSASVAQYENVYYTPLAVMTGSELSVEMTGTGDADLYVRFDEQPTRSSYDCRPLMFGSAERCDLEVPAGVSEAFIMVRGHSPADYELTVSWVEP